jgi:FlaA1/EpsC-like NDP-sugar epimerase
LKRPPDTSRMGKSNETEELLGRTEVQFDLGPAFDYLRGKVVLVTGAGGSIGSELCASILGAEPATLIAVDRAELGIYELDERFGRKHGQTDIVMSLSDVTCRSKMERLFSDHQIDVVFHAAAYKHVRYVEENPEDGILNNVLGTQTIADLALQSGCEKFVLISSDKAVEPVSVMGATKRLCEMIVRDLSDRGDADFITVRFGNVVRSRGSVIPKLEKQIAAGVPLTVHLEAERYFMSMAEAVGLVLKSLASGGNGDICIQNMGAPIRITDIAQRLLKASGIPEAGALLEKTGLLPGERIREKLTTSDEEAEATDCGHMLVCRNSRKRQITASDIEGLVDAARKGDQHSMRQTLVSLIQDYQPQVVS